MDIYGLEWSGMARQVRQCGVCRGKARYVQGLARQAWQGMAKQGSAGRGRQGKAGIGVIWPGEARQAT